MLNTENIAVFNFTLVIVVAFSTLLALIMMILDKNLKTLLIWNKDLRKIFFTSRNATKCFWWNYRFTLGIVIVVTTAFSTGDDYTTLAPSSFH
jgi:hypothetical protein